MIASASSLLPSMKVPAGPHDAEYAAVRDREDAALDAEEAE